MKKQKDILGILLAGTTGVALLVAMALRAFAPRIILPNFDASAVILVSLIALVLDHYLAKGSRHDFRLIPLYALLIFGLFPWAACFLAPMAALEFGLLGCIVFTALAFLFDTLMDRLASGPAAKFAPLISAFGLYLACQCLIGII